MKYKVSLPAKAKVKSHQYSTRNSVQNFKIPKSTTIISGSFYYNAIWDWNSLPSETKSITNKQQFKKSVKDHLLNQISC